MNEDNPLVTKEAAEYLEMNESTLRNKVAKGEIPSYKPAGKRYFYKSELDAWIKGEQIEKESK